jgi:hypothetical protein
MALMMVCPHCGDETTLSPVLLRQLPAAVRCLSCSHSFQSLDCLQFYFSNRVERMLNRDENPIHIPPTQLYGVVGEGGAVHQPLGESLNTVSKISWRYFFKRMGWFLLLLCLIFFYFRQSIVDRLPVFQGVYEPILSMMGKDGALPENITAFSTEHSEINYKSGLLEIKTFLRNTDDYPIAWPMMELNLLDKNRKVVIRRILEPKEYIPLLTESPDKHTPKQLKKEGVLSRKEYQLQMYVHYPLSLGQVVESQMNFFYPNQN